MLAATIVTLVALVVLLLILTNATITNNPVYNLASLALYISNQLLYPNLINITSAHPVGPPVSRNVVFLMCHDLDVLPEYAVKSKFIFSKYCKRHGYEYMDIKYPKRAISPYWIRVDVLMKLLREYPTNTLFVYVDLDTCINPDWFDRSIDDMLTSLNTTDTYDIYIGKEPMPTRILNSGVIILRNTDWTQALLQEWWSRYDPSCWSYKNGKWVCDGAWAGDMYEQGALNNIYREDWNEAQRHIAILHSDVISNNFRRCSRSYIYHLMTQKDHWRNKFFQEMIEIIKV